MIRKTDMFVQRLELGRFNAPTPKALMGHDNPKCAKGSMIFKIVLIPIHTTGIGRPFRPSS
jgi:hypothetical protein